MVPPAFRSAGPSPGTRQNPEIHQAKPLISRPGFTLVEVTVVLSITMVLGAMAVRIVPRVQDGQKVGQGASQLQGWLLMAKQWARRDHVPCGLRLTPGRQYPEPGNPTTLWVHDLQYLQQPDDFSGGQVDGSWNPSTNRYEVTASGVDFWGGFGAGDSALWPIQHCDYILFGNGGTGASKTFRVQEATSPTTMTIANAGAATPSNPSTSDYRIVRGARPRMGEAVLQLPQGIIIDLSTNASLPSSANKDILFTPAGTVMCWPASGDQIHLWVRDATELLSAGGVIVTIHCRTGMICTNPADAAGSDPYIYTRDPKASGM